MNKQELLNRNVIFEFHSIGQYIKVIALDEKSLTEISIQGPKGTPERLLKQNALKRLKYVLEKKGIL